jgi:hypothetical protein
MMGALEKYFSYTMMLLCGFPSATLLGEREDWVTLSKKLEKLQQIGDEPARFDIDSSFGLTVSDLLTAMWEMLGRELRGSAKARFRNAFTNCLP